MPDQPNQGLNGTVYALTKSGIDLYVGGAFTQTDGGSPTSLGHVARYHTTTGTWSPLPYGGMEKTVRALAVSGRNLYVGGDFTQTGDTTELNDLGRIVRYNSNDGKWHRLNNEGLNDSVRALVVSGDDLYVGGIFYRTGDDTVTKLYRIVYYDTKEDTWQPLPANGLNNYVYALALSGGDLYVGGLFTGTKSTPFVQVLNHIARCELDFPNINGYLPLVFKQ